ncbi:hypothetical protein R1sor_025466 [Riccia sorocarpa]|uniref:Uncharacterized protein n=1 Tax=Riccia sorocarpa TaxID=122646 RepID=A0ABD3G977_9MARC
MSLPPRVNGLGLHKKDLCNRDKGGAPRKRTNLTAKNETTSNPPRGSKSMEKNQQHRKTFPVGRGGGEGLEFLKEMNPRARLWKGEVRELGPGKFTPLPRQGLVLLRRRKKAASTEKPESRFENDLIREGGVIGGPAKEVPEIGPI